jgi:SAM-dependent methyltransferase
VTDHDYARRLNQHYASSDLRAAFEAVLQAWGKAEGPLAPDDLAPLDQFHLGGKAATLALAEIAQVGPRTRVLDVGGGFGGPARTLAATYGCPVTVVDLTEAYCRVGEWLTARTGLSERVSFQHGSALDLPFPEGAFDLVWTQHSTMNVADKDRLYREIFRVLRPAGQYALYEIMAGPNPPVIYPVPWAADASLSFLVPPDNARKLFGEVGFDIVRWEDLTATMGTLAPPRNPEATAAGTAVPPPGLQLVLGPDFADRLRNMLRNLAEQRTVLVRALVTRP